MNTLLFLLAALSADPAGVRETVYTPSKELAAAVRGQAPNYEELPQSGTSDGVPLYTVPSDQTYQGGFGSPFQSTPMMTDPFLGQPGGVPPYGGVNPCAPPGMPGGCFFGANGPQPYRFGWTPRMEVGYMPREDTDGLGRMGILEVDADLMHRAPLADGSVFSFGPEFNFRWWDGPDGAGLPSDVYRIAGDFEIASPVNGPWSGLIGFTPAFSTDFQRSPSSDAWTYDVRGVLFFRSSPQWMWAFGAAYWDRVRDRVIPYAGIVWNPNDRWEWRLIFPEPRISYFVGNVGGVASWFYVRGEYRVEAYEVTLDPADLRTQMEIEDWRVLAGIRTDSGFVGSFIEAGWVFGRDVRFKSAPGFDISSGFIARLGLRF